MGYAAFCMAQDTAWAINCRRVMGRCFILVLSGKYATLSAAGTASNRRRHLSLSFSMGHGTRCASVSLAGSGLFQMCWTNQNMQAMSDNSNQIGRGQGEGEEVASARVIGYVFFEGSR